MASWPSKADEVIDFIIYQMQVKIAPWQEKLIRRIIEDEDGEHG